MREVENQIKNLHSVNWTISYEVNETVLSEANYKKPDCNNISIIFSGKLDVSLQVILNSTYM